MSARIKIAYIIHRFPYLTETFIMREIYWLRQQGLDVQIFSLLEPKHSVVHDQAKELLKYTTYSPFVSWNVFKSQFHFLLRSPLRYFKSLANVFLQTYREPAVLVRALVLFPKSVWFARLIEKENVNHIHSHFVWLDGIAAGVVFDLTGITFTIHPHAFGLFSRNQKSVKRELEHATQIVTISKFHRKYIQDLCPDIKSDKINVVYCGMEAERFQPQSIPTGERPVQLLSIGRLTEKKGFEYLISACRNLADRGLEFKCQVIGGGDLKHELQKKIVELQLEEFVELAGSKSQQQVIQAYQESDIFVLPCVVASDGDRDGIPVVLMEAMACEVPVITTPVTGIPDLVLHEETGLLVAERDVDGLTEAIQRLICDSGFRTQLGRQGRRTVLEKFDVKKNVSKLAAIFQRITNSNLMASTLAKPSKSSAFFSNNKISSQNEN